MFTPYKCLNYTRDCFFCQMMLWLNNFMQNRRLSYILQKYREQFHAGFCPKCWAIRAAVVVVIASALLYWF